MFHFSDQGHSETLCQYKDQNSSLLPSSPVFFPLHFTATKYVINIKMKSNLNRLCYNFQDDPLQKCHHYSVNQVMSLPNEVSITLDSFCLLRDACPSLKIPKPVSLNFYNSLVSLDCKYPMVSSESDINNEAFINSQNKQIRGSSRINSLVSPCQDSHSPQFCWLCFSSTTMSLSIICGHRQVKSD